MSSPRPGYTFSRELHVEGHLIDSGIMSACMDLIIKNDGEYEIHEFVVGKSHEQPSRARFTIFARSDAELLRLCEGLHGHGCQPVVEENALLEPAPKNWVVPEHFYATTNHLTEIRLDGVWYKATDQRMDAILVCAREGNGWNVVCRKPRDVKAGDLVACGIRGIRIRPESKERDREEFAFMNSEVSSERRVKIAVRKIAHLILEKRRSGGRLGITLGPVVVHTGGAEFLAKMIREGYVDFLLSGNASAVHDIEQNLYRTSLGIDIESGEPVEDGHRNHLRAINTIFRCGSIRQAVEQGVLTQGVFYECVKRNVPFALAGSIRDDGPLPEVYTDMVEAQKAYFGLMQGCTIMLILSTMLHGIGVGNMLPGWVKTICVDINPAVVTKLADRGSHQTIGIVTDVGSFLSALYHDLKLLERESPEAGAVR
ncbi:MAG TPA: TIGR00300 family protein [Candidatus Ozemobacteraceae bacterium]|nr:TIGR00300 family protein [Candidatus Ozemobacteraceae bacterium]